MKQNMCYRQNWTLACPWILLSTLPVSSKLNALPLEDTAVLVSSCIQILKTTGETAGYENWLNPKPLSMKKQHNAAIKDKSGK